jgi:hypothetical protein
MAVAMVAMLNPIAWIWTVFFSRSNDFFDEHGNQHLARPLKIGLINLLVLGGLIMVGQDELGVRYLGFSQVFVGSILAGAGMHFVAHFVGLVISRRKELASGAITAAHAVADSASSQLDRITPFSPDRYDDHSYATAMEEIESGELRKATWAKSLAVTDGNVEKAQAKYIVLRVKELENN